MLWMSCLLLLAYVIYAYKKYAHIIPGFSFFSSYFGEKDRPALTGATASGNHFQLFKALLNSTSASSSESRTCYQLGEIYEHAQLFSDAKIQYRMAITSHEDPEAAYALCRLLAKDGEWDEALHVSAKYLQYPHLALTYYHAVLAVRHKPQIGSTLDPHFNCHPMAANWSEAEQLTDAIDHWPIQVLQQQFALTKKVNLLCTDLTVYRIKILAQLIIEQPTAVFKIIHEIKPAIFSEVESTSDLLSIAQTLHAVFHERCGLYCQHCRIPTSSYHHFCTECGAVDQWAEVSLGQYQLNAGSV